MKICLYIIAGLILLSAHISCSNSKNLTEPFYYANETALQLMKQRFRQQYDTRPFSLEVKYDASLQVGLEIIDDSIRYIYDFPINDPSLADTLKKYRFNIALINGLITDMQKTHCTWLTNLDYYENLEKKFVVFASIRDRKLESVFKKDKYFTLAFFDFPQPFDDKGRLLDRKDRKRLRKINGDILFRIEDKVAFALTSHYR